MRESLTVLLIFVALSCGGQVEDLTDAAQDVGRFPADAGPLPDGGSAVAASLVAKDGTGRDLGWILGVADSHVTLLSVKGYLYRLRWDLRPYYGEIWAFSEVNCAGERYIVTGGDLPTRGQTAYFHPVNGAQHVPTEVTVEALAIPEMAAFVSQMGSLGQCQNVTMTRPLIGVVEAGPDETGIPAVINPPLVIEQK